MTILGAIKEQLGSDWDAFLESLQEEASNQLNSQRSNDGASIDFSFFKHMLKEGYDIKLLEADQVILLKTFAAKSEATSAPKINLKPILQLKNH